jgi:hypothetical protein
LALGKSMSLFVPAWRITHRSSARYYDNPVPSSHNPQVPFAFRLFFSSSRFSIG